MDGLVMRLKFVACLCMSLFMTGSAIAAESTDTKVNEIVKKSSNDTELKGGYEPDDSACFNYDLDGCKKKLINVPNYKIRSAANGYHLSSDKIHAAMRREIDSVNKKTR